VAYIKTHWEGKFSLPQSYWLNSVVIATIVTLVLAFSFGVVIGISATSVGAALPADPVMNFLGAIVSIPVLIWSMVGTWRSADAYITARPDSWFTWGSMAKICITLGAMRSVFYIIGTMLVL
jgi:hypothetical protein